MRWKEEVKLAHAYKTFAYLFGVMILCMAVTMGTVNCAGTKTAKIGGVATEDEFIKQAGNRIYNAETTAVVVGRVLIDARAAGLIEDGRWQLIREASQKLDLAFTAAKYALLAYNQAKSVENADAVTVTLALMEVAAVTLAKFQREDG